MKRASQIFTIIIVAFLFFYSNTLAQEHYTEGNVREVNYYRTNPGQFDNYMKYLRENFLPQQEEAKKQGLIVGYSVLLNRPSSPDDWDVAVVFIHKNFGDALDYNKGDDDKMKEIQANHFKTKDENKITDMTAKRFEMRKFIGVKYLREVILKRLN